MEINSINLGDRLNYKFSFFSVMISFILVVNFLFIMIKGEQEMNNLSRIKLFNSLELNEQSIISSKEEYKDDSFTSFENFEINFHRLLKISERQNVYYQRFLESYYTIDPDYKSK